MNLMKQGNHDVAFVVDPDVDRLAMICEDGKMYGEEYTLVTVADYVLSNTPGNTVSNLSSTRALRDVTRKYGMEYNAAAVGEVNVVTKMKDTNAIIGGEGNGGVIYPQAHYGRDALVGIALFLSHLAHKGCTVSELRKTYPEYQIAKNRIDLDPTTDVDAILTKVKDMFTNDPNVQVNDIDGVKIDFEDKWVHLRKSNTEPIIRWIRSPSTSPPMTISLWDSSRLTTGWVKSRRPGRLPSGSPMTLWNPRGSSLSSMSSGGTSSNCAPISYTT